MSVSWPLSSHYLIQLTVSSGKSALPGNRWTTTSLNSILLPVKPKNLPWNSSEKRVPQELLGLCCLWQVRAFKKVDLGTKGFQLVNQTSGTQKIKNWIFKNEQKNQPYFTGLSIPTSDQPYHPRRPPEEQCGSAQLFQLPLQSLLPRAEPVHPPPS
jgi:hypothetical protein